MPASRDPTAPASGPAVPQASRRRPVRRLFALHGACAALLGAAITLLPGLASAQAARTPSCAVVLMHGKWGNPQYISFFGRRLEPECRFKSIEMPWSARRGYDATYVQALDQIAEEIRAFRAQGHIRVLLAGHSFGANAAMAYMADRGDADGVIALAPGHSPAYSYAQGIGRAAVDEARAKVAAGQGAERLSMDDLNQGRRQTLRMRADVLLSYFDPEGLGHMPGTAARFKRPVPFLWVIGTADPLYRAGEDFAFAKAPPHPASRYLVVDADHARTPDVAVDQVKAWILSLP